jgi:hypothetical protein
MQDMGVTAIQTTVNLDVTSFARLLAKIGYGFAIARFGLLAREDVPILPVILGMKDDASNWLGSAHFHLDVELKNPTHAVGVACIPDPSDAKSSLILARVKLFVASGATGYEIVVCRPFRSAA